MHVTAPLPGVVVDHHVSVGDTVAEGDRMLTIETMKLEGAITAPTSGRVRSLSGVGDLVVAGQDVASVATAVARARPLSPSDVLACALSTTPRGRFQEMDLAADGGLHRVRRPIGSQQAGLVLGTLSHKLPGHVRATERVWIGGDPERALGAVAEPECRRIIAAFDHARDHGLPVEWVAVSSGARISMSSGTENMDWCAAVVRRIIEFTQAGGTVIVIVAGINVGAQSYWNSVATMLGHCAGLLVMVEGSSMVLTGPRALARSGGTPVTDELELGGYRQVMGPNGEAHHVAPDLSAAYDLVLEHHRMCAATAGPGRTNDPIQRDVCASPYAEPGVRADSILDGPGPARTIGDLLRASSNPGRKRPYRVRPIMDALRDSDSDHLERWPDMAGADGAVVWDTRLGGRPTTLIGIESHPRPNPSEQGPPWWSGSTLYPAAAKKISRALTHASGRRPVVVLANLAGFDGSAWSLRQQQLEWGAEIARSVVNFEGRIVVVVTGRFHGGAYVVFNKTLNEDLRMLAIEGSRVSVIGGSAAAEVALTRRVAARASQLPGPPGDRQATARALVADEFDRTHSVGRAFEMGSVDRVIPAEQLRPAVIQELRAGRGVSARAPARAGSRVPVA